MFGTCMPNKTDVIGSNFSPSSYVNMPKKEEVIHASFNIKKYKRRINKKKNIK